MMKTLLCAAVFLSFAAPSCSQDFRLDGLSLSDLAVPAEAPAAAAAKSPAPSREETPQELLNKLQQFGNDLSRLDRDTYWLRRDIEKLETEARGIAQGNPSHMFHSEMRWLRSDMARRRDELKRLATELRNLSAQAQKDAALNRLARDIELNARDLDRRFQFDITYAAQSLDSTVRAMDPTVIGYDSQWIASDVYRTCRDMRYDTRQLSGDASGLVRKTQP